MYRAVIFDIGGVVMQSPFVVIAEYERKLDLPVNYLNCSIMGLGSQSTWAKFERGEMDLHTFYEEFERELSDVENGNIWYKAYCVRKGLVLPDRLTVNGRELFGAMILACNQYDPHIRNAILRLKAAGRHKLIALTNNFGNISIPEDEAAVLGLKDGLIPSHLRKLFDDFCDSSSLGMRKPDPGFYLLACERNGIKPSEAIFLDDIILQVLHLVDIELTSLHKVIRNLKSAKELGMKTIHVAIGRTLDAVKELEKLVALDLSTASLEHKL